jgi:hypothetical protein
VNRVAGVALSLLIAVPALAGDVYKWRDARGQLHFGDEPPAGVRAERAEVRAAARDDSTAGGGLRAGERVWLKEIEARRKKAEAEKRRRAERGAAAQARREAQAERDARRCAGERQKIREYRNRLRAGCRVSACNAYNARLARHQSRAALVCR